MNMHNFHLGLALLVSALLTGCGGGGPLVEIDDVSGIVTRAGQPVSDASVTFYPADGSPSAANTDSEGRLELKYSASENGAVVGSHTVAFKVGSSAPTSMLGMPAAKDSRKIADQMKAPETIEWGEKVMVESDGSEFTFDLP